MSATTGHAAEEALSQHGFRAALSKPYRLEDLHATLTAVLRQI